MPFRGHHLCRLQAEKGAISVSYYYEMIYSVLLEMKLFRTKEELVIFLDQCLEKGLICTEIIQKDT